jgi:hypothetical protein
VKASTSQKKKKPAVKKPKAPLNIMEVIENPQWAHVLESLDEE